MIPPRKSHRERKYAPQEAKSFRHSLSRFILREFPRLGGPWIVEHFVDKLLALLDEHHVQRDRLQPGQTVWMAVAADEGPGYRKTMHETRQVPVILTLTRPVDITALKQGTAHRQVLRQAIARVAQEACEQGGVLGLTDLGLLFARSPEAIGYQIKHHESETGQVIPRRGTVHDMGMTISHKRIICHKAFVEGKSTPVIARETYHTPRAVDNYLLDFARVYFAVHKRGLSPEETAFTIGRGPALVRTYLRLIEEFGLSETRIADRVPVELLTNDDRETRPK